MGYDIGKEKREAIDAGYRAINSLKTARDNLNSAKNWGLLDIRQDKTWNRQSMIFVISAEN